MGFFAKLFGKAVSKPASNVIDSVGKLAKDIREAVTGDMPAEIRAEIYKKTLDISMKILDTQASVINTEAQGQSWLQRNWRPLAMIDFLVIINLALFRVVDFSGVAIPVELWRLITIGITGYIGGRTIEKAVVTLTNKK